MCDGHAGLLKAIELVYPQVPVQRCWMHKIRNVLDKVKRSDRKKVAEDLRKIYKAKSMEEAENALRLMFSVFFRYNENQAPIYCLTQNS